MELRPMFKMIFIKNGTIINEGKSVRLNILIKDDEIIKIGSFKKPSGAFEIDAKGLMILPGVIDTHVHFREPGFTNKGNIRSESMAAAAGGITSFLEMPNTVPNAITNKILEEKLTIAKKTSLINYSFYLGIGNNNEYLAIDTTKVPAITDDGLSYTTTEALLCNNNEKADQVLYCSAVLNTETIVAVHAEDRRLIKRNTERYYKKYGDTIPFKYHINIRSTQTCFEAAKKIISKAKKYNTRLHLLNISSRMESKLFLNKLEVNEKRITAEVCVPHLHFCHINYPELGGRIKCNPSIKTFRDKEALWEALLEDRIDIISTDHAPHTLKEKREDYFKCPSGMPMVQHALPLMLYYVNAGKISIEKVVEKMCHNPAIIFNISKRGFIKRGFKADIVLVDMQKKWKVSKANILYKCNWSPLEGFEFDAKIVCTLVNGQIVYRNDVIRKEVKAATELVFNL
jgi:dihydroorotase